MVDSADPNPHVMQILVELMLEARSGASTAELQARVSEAAGKIERAVREKDVLLSEKQVAARYPFLSEYTLRSQRRDGKGPKYLKFGKHRNSRVYYRIADIETWILAHYQMTPFVQGLEDG